MEYLAEIWFWATGAIQDGQTKKCPVTDTNVMAKSPRGTQGFMSSNKCVLNVRSKELKFKLMTKLPMKNCFFID